MWSACFDGRSLVCSVSWSRVRRRSFGCHSVWKNWKQLSIGCRLNVILSQMQQEIATRMSTSLTLFVILQQRMWVQNLFTSWFLLVSYKLCLFRSTPPSRPNKAGLNVCLSVRTYIRMYDVCMYVHRYVRQCIKSFSDSNEIWYVGRARWVMHDGMLYGPIQGQDHVVLKVRNSSIFKIYLLRHFQWELTSDCWFLN